MLQSANLSPDPTEPPLVTPAHLNALTAAVIDAIGQPSFPAALAELCQCASGYDSTLTTAFFDDHRPVELYDNLSAEACSATVGPYLDSAYLLDPFYDLFRQGTKDGVFSLQDCAPDDFRASEYFLRFYADTGLFDETTMLISFGDGAAIAISLGSRTDGFCLSREGRNTLLGLLPVIAALCHRHWPQLTPESISDHGRMGQHLEKSFQMFGTSVLSPREAEIVRLVLKGHSSKSVARELGNSPETVKVHRKRIYAKLEIASQGELFSLFLNALSSAPPNADADPYTYLDRADVIH